MEHGGEVRDVSVEQAGVPTPLEVQLDSQKAINRIGAISQVIDGCAKTSIQRTNPQDWVRQTSKDGGKESFYLQATGAQKIRPIFGIYYRDRQVTKEIYPDGGYAYIVTGIVGSKVLDQLYGEITIDIDGGRSSSDAFFAGRDGKKEVDPLDIRKAALANWEARAITALLGLKNLCREDLAKNGIDVSKIPGVSYQQGAEGGGQTNLISDGQRKRFYAIYKGAGVTDPHAKALIEAYGFAASEAITRDKYEEICTVVQGGAAKVDAKLQELAQRAPELPA